MIAKSKLITLDKAGGVIMKSKEEEKDSPFLAEPKFIQFVDY